MTNEQGPNAQKVKKNSIMTNEQDPNPQKVKKNAVYYDKTQHANFRGKPLFQATKQHLNNS